MDISNFSVEEKKTNNNLEKMDRVTIILIVIAIALILFSFSAPYIFTHFKSGIELPKDNIIGDTIGGIMNPFVTLAGVLITFLAFYMQYRANKLQRKLFNEQIDEQRLQFKKSQFESQFYEMLRLHKENVNEMSITGYDIEKIESIESHALGMPIASAKKTTTIQAIERQISGRKLFVAMKTELETIIEFYKKYVGSFDKKAFEVCYKIFFFGLDHAQKERNSEADYLQFLSKLSQARMAHQESNGKGNTFEKIKIYIKYKPFSGHQSRLAHYYRHLFLTVKFIAKQNEGFVTYEEKRNYLRTLRAQLSNHEQALLFYNWLSEFGQQWEFGENKFFTDYRMIHNLYQDLIIQDFKLEILFIKKTDPYRKEKDREHDPLFEYEDW